MKTNRRQFLQRTGSAALTAVAASVAFPHLRGRAADAGVGVRQGVRVGVIGTGGRGSDLMRSALANVMAVCDVDRSHLAKASAEVEKKNGRKPAEYTDYRKLLENRDIDAVIVGTPDHWHALVTVDACQAGKDVYCEKPLTLTLHEGRVMTQVARSTRRIVQTGSQQRSDDKFRLGCELVRNGRIGKIKSVRVGLTYVNFDPTPVPDSEPPPELDYDRWLGPAPWRAYNRNRVHYNFRFFWDYSGGQMTNWGAHHLDIAQWGLGADTTGPVEIQATAKFDSAKRFEVPIESDITYRYADGVVLDCTQGPDRKTGTTFTGEKGWIHVNRGNLEASDDEILVQPLPADALRLYASKDHMDNWFECIKSRKLPICDVEIGHRSASVCHLGSLAIRLSRKLSWNPEKEEFNGDAEANRMRHYPYRDPWKLPALV
ncbi:MAG: Gfo/Idh/MocA family oxidoreductase [Verrucomicrobiales bacterium]|nr:Gfo/Idh/MocA family oxidoreductase [Verrucomicrobiales bacterium]